jgi:hypothetical protein
MKLFYLYNNSWYFVPSAYQDSPTNFAGGITLESVNQLNGINEYYFNHSIIQKNGNLNQSILWIPEIKILNNTNYTIELTPQTLWNLTIIGSNYTRTIIGSISNVTLQKGKYIIIAKLEIAGNTLESFVINMSSNNISKANVSYINQFNILIYIGGFVTLLIIIAIILRKIKKIL